MGDISSQLVARTSQEPQGGIFIGVANSGAVATADTADVSQAFPNITKVLYAHWTGTAANANSVGCTIGGTARITFGTGGGTDGEVMIIGQAL